MLLLKPGQPLEPTDGTAPLELIQERERFRITAAKHHVPDEHQVDERAGVSHDDLH
jgi:hypothetical protein